ncbi:hypothetical protein ACFQ3J_19735 [Paenibacillus provencensis]|uniref:Uncharacterized protein n=1 Tax=Paenibacillus provencensis TaxID=441151 RepID=A0ABW3PUS5_9BACL|nr:hypothetical protein [Paenibacillus sp. MER 78]MCM3129356.1 hypothetical protein [Paenibacillus sp. MER 78]
MTNLERIATSIPMTSSKNLSTAGSNMLLHHDHYRSYRMFSRLSKHLHQDEGEIKIL